MTINISFSFDTDMDKFYNDFINDLPSIVSSAKVEVKNKSVVLDIDPINVNSFYADKVLMNDIKQYMRDNEVPHEITV